jgi:FkbM family methyltransferase
MDNMEKNGGLIANIFNGVSYRFSQLSKGIFNTAHGLNIFQLKYLKHLSDSKDLRSVKLDIGRVYYYSPINLYHSLEEIFEDQIYLQTLNENSFILDCGANIGLSVAYLKKLCPTAEIHAFEPDPVNFDLLSKNIESCNLEKVVLHKKAVWNDNTTLIFANTGSLSSHIDLSQKAEGIKVEALRLKDFMTRPVDFLKIDIEGAEYEVIKDIADELHLVKSMFLEYHGKFSQNHELLEMFKIVEKAGFNFYIREAAPVYKTPFYKKDERKEPLYDLQLNIFCFKI